MLAKQCLALFCQPLFHLKATSSTASEVLPLSCSKPFHTRRGQIMIRFHLALLFAAITAFALPTALVAGEKPATKAGEGHEQHYFDCADACHHCARMCEACATHCGRMIADGKKEHLETLQTCRDCASICTAAASVTARIGPFSESICKSCAEACKRCAAACAKHKDSPMMARCAEACLKCEKACNDMLKHISTAR